MAKRADALEPSWPRRFGSYLAERFPPGPYALLIAALCAATIAAADAGAGGVRLGLRDLAAFVVVFFFFFHLRVFDEHKDAAADVKAHPDRVLSRGVVTLRQLARAGTVAILVEAVLSLLLGTVPGLHWVAAFVFSALMAVEFFAPGFLRRHIVVYAVTHNPVVVLLVLFVDAVHRDGAPFDARALAFGLVATFSSLGFEIARKLRAPEDEREGQETYTAALGVGPAVALLLAVQIFTSTSAHVAGLVLGTSVLFTWGAPVLLWLSVLPAVSFARSPTPKGAKATDAAASLAALLLYLGLAADVIIREGIKWTA